MSGGKVGPRPVPVKIFQNCRKLKTAAYYLYGMKTTYYTLKQAAAALGVSYRKLHWHLREGNLPSTCNPIGQHSPLWTEKKLESLRRWFAEGDKPADAGRRVLVIA